MTLCVIYLLVTFVAPGTSVLNPPRWHLFGWHQAPTWNDICGSIPFPFWSLLSARTKDATFFLCDHFTFAVKILLPRLGLLVHAFSDTMLYLHPKWLWALLLLEDTVIWCPGPQYLGMLLANSHQPLWLTLAVMLPFQGSLHPGTCQHGTIKTKPSSSKFGQLEGSFQFQSSQGWLRLSLGLHHSLLSPSAHIYFLPFPSTAVNPKNTS